jgi:hypothetical protein
MKLTTPSSIVTNTELGGIEFVFLIPLSRVHLVQVCCRISVFTFNTSSSPKAGYNPKLFALTTVRILTGRSFGQSAGLSLKKTT